MTTAKELQKQSGYSLSHCYKLIKDKSPAPAAPGEHATKDFRQEVINYANETSPKDAATHYNLDLQKVYRWIAATKTKVIPSDTLILATSDFKTLANTHGYPSPQKMLKSANINCTPADLKRYIRLFGANSLPFTRAGFHFKKGLLTFAGKTIDIGTPKDFTKDPIGWIRSNAEELKERFSKVNPGF